MPDVNQIIGFLMEELKQDALRKDDDPFKMSKYRRDDMFDKLVRLQLSKGKVRKVLVNAQGLTVKNNVKLGRPRKDLHPDTGSKSFMRELHEKLKDKERFNGQEMDRLGDQEARANHADGEAAGDLEVGGGE